MTFRVCRMPVPVERAIAERAASAEHQYCASRHACLCFRCGWPADSSGLAACDTNFLQILSLSASCTLRSLSIFSVRPCSGVNALLLHIVMAGSTALWDYSDFLRYVADLLMLAHMQ